MMGLLTRLRGGRGWPVPVPRNEAMSVVNEEWPEYIPPEPMTHKQAEGIAAMRRLFGHDPVRMARLDWMRERMRPR